MNKTFNDGTSVIPYGASYAPASSVGRDEMEIAMEGLIESQRIREVQRAEDTRAYANKSRFGKWISSFEVPWG